MAITTDDIREIQALSQGRHPDWEEQDSTTGAPAIDLAGVKLGDKNILSYFAIHPREDIAFKTSRVTVVTAASSTYTVTIDGNAVDHISGGGESELDILTALRDNINADGTVSTIVTASLEDADADGTDDTLLIKGDGETTYSISVSATSTGELALSEDATSCDFRLYARAGGSDDNDRWSQINNGTGSAGYRGLTERLVTAGYDRLYVEVHSVVPVDANVTVFVGPAIIT